MVVNFGKRKRRKTGIFLLFISILIILPIFLVQARIKPVLSAIAESRAKNIASQAVNEAVWQVLSEENVKYDSLVELSSTTEGKITAIKVNSVALNKICSQIRSRVTEYLNGLDEREISIPIGSLTGIDMLAGKGPDIHISITLSGSSEAKIINDFETAGINQTRHQMILDITTNVYVIMQSENISAQISNSVVVAETVIVGEVPEIYSDGKSDMWQNLIGYKD